MAFLQEQQKEILEEKMLYARKENDSSYVTDYVEHLLSQVVQNTVEHEREMIIEYFKDKWLGDDYHGDAIRDGINTLIEKEV